MSAPTTFFKYAFYTYLCVCACTCLFTHIYIYIYIYIYIGGWDCESNREIVFVSFVRASGRGEAVWACEALFFPGLGCGRSSCPVGWRGGGVTSGSLARWIAAYRQIDR